MHYIYLFFAIICEVVATSSIKASEEFTRLWPTLVVLVAYASAFYMLSLCLRTLSLGITYAYWCGFGIILVALVDIFLYKQSFDIGAIVGMTLIIAGTVVIRLFSQSAVH